MTHPPRGKEERREGCESSINWGQRGGGERERGRVRMWERESKRASLLVVGVYLCVCLCVLPFVCVCCVMETFSGSTNDYTAVKPSQWRRKRGCKVRCVCYLILPLTFNVLSLLNVTCYYYFNARGKFLSFLPCCNIHWQSAVFAFPPHYLCWCSSCSSCRSVVFLLYLTVAGVFFLGETGICLISFAWAHLCI